MRWIKQWWFNSMLTGAIMSSVVWVLVWRACIVPPIPQHCRIDLYESGKIIQTWHGRMTESGTHLVYFIDDETGKEIGVRGTIVTTPEGER